MNGDPELTVVHLYTPEGIGTLVIYISHKKFLSCIHTHLPPKYIYVLHIHIHTLYIYLYISYIHIHTIYNICIYLVRNILIVSSSFQRYKGKATFYFIFKLFEYSYSVHRLFFYKTNF